MSVDAGYTLRKWRWNSKLEVWFILVQMIFLFNWLIFGFQPLIFRGVWTYTDSALWQSFKLLVIIDLAGKNKFKLLFHGPHWLSKYIKSCDMKWHDSLTEVWLWCCEQIPWGRVRAPSAHQSAHQPTMDIGKIVCRMSSDMACWNAQHVWHSIFNQKKDNKIGFWQSLTIETCETHTLFSTMNLFWTRETLVTDFWMGGFYRMR